MSVFPSDPRRQRPPAPGSPLRDYLNHVPHPGVNGSYVVLPRSLAESMPLPWQQALTQILDEFHRTYAHLDWPEYRVVPSRRERLVNLDEDQLAEVGYLVEIDGDGELVYRERNGRRVADPENTEVLVSCLDPIPTEHRNANQDTPPRGFPAPQVSTWS